MVSNSGGEHAGISAKYCGSQSKVGSPVRRHRYPIDNVGNRMMQVY